MTLIARCLPMIAAAWLSFAPSPWARKMDLEIHRAGYVQGVELQAAEYQIMLAPSLEEISFYRGGDRLVTARCKVHLAEKRPVGDSVHYARGEDGKERILRILLAQQMLDIELPE